MKVPLTEYVRKMRGGDYDEFIKKCKEVDAYVEKLEAELDRLNSGVDENEAPEGYRAELSTNGLCTGCAFDSDGICKNTSKVICVPKDRADNRSVIFVEK